jgi:hypothetical protein
MIKCGNSEDSHDAYAKIRRDPSAQTALSSNVGRTILLPGPYHDRFPLDIHVQASIPAYIGTQATQTVIEFIRRDEFVRRDEPVRYTLNGQNRLTLRRNGENWSCVAGAQTQFSWQLNRQEATKVRLRYKEFIDYFKAVVSLRTEGFTSRYTDYERMGIRLSLAEMCEAFEVVGIVIA